MSVALGWTAYVAGVGQVDGVAGTLDIEQHAGERSVANVTLQDPTAAYDFADGTRVALVDNATGLPFFGGVIDSSEAEIFSNGDAALGGGIAAGMEGVAPSLLHHVALADFCALADKIRAAKSYEAQTADAIARDLHAVYLAAEGIWHVKNLLTANQSSAETDLTGLAATDSNLLQGTPATLTRDATHALFGGTAVKVVTTGGNSQGVVTVPGVAVPAGRTAIFSLYVYCDAVLNGALRVRDYTNNGATLGVAQNTVAGQWVRFSYAYTQPAGGPASGDVRLCFRYSGAGTFWVDGLQVELVPVGYEAFTTQPTDWEPGGTSTIATGGPVIGATVFSYARVSDCLDKLAEDAGGWWWNVDEWGRFYFGPYAQWAAPWDPTLADMDEPTIKKKNQSPLYRNGQYELGGQAQTDPQTETRKGDGATRAFTMSFPLATVPAITVNGVAKTVGIRGIDAGKDFYWNKGDNTISQDSSGTLLTSADTLQVVYTGLFPLVVYAEDGGAVTGRAALDGGTGKVQDVEVNASIDTLDAGFARANAQLQMYAVPSYTLTFGSRRGGLKPGMFCHPTVALLRVTGADLCLVQSAAIRDQGADLDRPYYTYTLVNGPLAGSWAKFYTRLVARSQPFVDALYVGNSQTLALLATFTGTPPAAVGNLNPVVQACLFPGAAVYPGAAQYPC